MKNDFGVKLTLEYNGRTITVEDEGDVTIDELLDMFHGAVVGQTYLETSWRSAIRSLVKEYDLQDELEGPFQRYQETVEYGPDATTYKKYTVSTDF